MRLINNHLVPGGVVKIYSENRNKIAKFAVDLMSDYSTEDAALSDIATNLRIIADAIDAVRNQEVEDKSVEGRRSAFLLGVRTGKIPHKPEHRPETSDMEFELDDPYADWAANNKP